jgi:RNA polymerase-binding protein DksA
MDLTREQIAKLEARLQQRKRELNGEIDDKLQASGQGLQELSGEVGDAGDESVAHMITDLDLASANRDVGELRDVERALQRIRDGTYGTCVQCGADIEPERLNAQPTALRCVECQTQFEKLHANHNTPTM